MAKKDIEYTVTISKEGSPFPRWNQPHLIELRARIAKRILEQKQVMEEDALNSKDDATHAG